MDSLMKKRLIAAALIGGFLYADPLQYTGVVGFDMLGMTIEGAVGGLIGGDLAGSQGLGASTFELFSNNGKTYAICGAIGGAVASYFNLGAMGSAALGAASVFLDYTIPPMILSKV